MAKEIGLKLKITTDGQEKVISNINQLETELKVLQDTLKTQDFGSEKFKETARSIQTLKSQIEDVDKATEGVGIEKRLTGIASAAGVLTGSFSVLTGVVSTFASSEESLKSIQEAQTKALGALNIVLGVREISEGILEGKIVARQLAESIATKATKVATAVQLAYNAALAANPIGLLIAGIVALGAAIYGLTKLYQANTDEVIFNNQVLEESKSIQQSLSIETKKTSTELKSQLSVLTDGISQRGLELKAIDDLKKAYPGFNAFLSENNTLNKEGIAFLKTRIALDESQARLKVLDQKILDAQIAKETSVSKIIEEQGGFWNSLGTSINAAFTFRSQYQIQAKEIVNVLGKENATLKAATDLKTKEQKALDALLLTNAKYQKQLEEEAKKDETRRKAAEAAQKALDAEIKSILKRGEALNKVRVELEKLSKTDLKYSSQILEKQKQVLDEQDAFLKDRTEKFKTAGEKLADEIANYLFKTIPSEEDAKKLADGYFQLFNVINDAVVKGDLDFKKATGWDEFVKFAETKLPGIGEQLKNVNEESRISFINYFNTLDERVNAIFSTIKSSNSTEAFKKIFDNGLISAQQLLSVEEDIANINATREKTGLTDTEIKKKSLDLIKQTFLNTKEIQKVNEDMSALAMTEKLGTPKEQANAKLKIEANQKVLDIQTQTAEKILESVINNNTFIDGLKKVNAEAEKNTIKIGELKTQIEGTFDPKQLEGLQQYFKDNVSQLSSVFEVLLKDSNKTLEKLGKNGIDAVFTGVNDGLKDIKDKSRTELEQIEKDLIKYGELFQKAFNLPENPFLKQLEDIKNKLNELPTSTEAAFNKTVEGLDANAQKILGIYSNLSSSISSIIQQQNSLVLEQLAYQEEQTLKSIGDATEAERAEQSKVQKKFAEERFKIEKRARVQELQFALANSLAQGAAAVISALKLGPIAGPIYAGVVGGITLAQIAVINDQLTFTQNKQFVGRRGGAILGSTHEQGGVPAMLEGGEFVMNKEAVKNYGNIISSINTSTGGRALAIDDSRIVQAIASQNTATKTPIKTYVLYGDIQDTDKLNNKIQQLSRL